MFILEISIIAKIEQGRKQCKQESSMEKEERPKFIKKLGYNQKRMKANVTISATTSFYKSKMMKLAYCMSNERSYDHVDKQTLKQFSVIGTIRNQIFCIYHEELGLFASVDQHAMHERVRYEYFCKMLQGAGYDKFIQRNIHKRLTKKNEVEATRVHSPSLLIFVCQTDPRNLRWQSITKYGFKLTADKHGKVYLRGYSYPFGRALNEQAIIQICIEIVALQLQNQKGLPPTLDSLIAQSSCKGAIKFGDQVTKQWCNELLYNASLCTFPWKCVHGRATVHFEQYQIRIDRKYALE